MKSSTVLIVGGGAAGHIAAIILAREAEKKGQKCNIIIAEKLDRVGKKLLATGNGTCNLTNENCTGDRYHGEERLHIERVLARFTPEDTVDFFSSLGVLTKTEGERVYPYSLQASSVLDCLRAETARRGVKERCSCEVLKMKKEKDGYTVRLKNETVFVDRVIITSGGRTAPSLGGGEGGYALLKSLGHTVTPLFPALVPVKSSSPICKSLKGIKFDGMVSVVGDGRNYRTESGEILFTDYGFSGPPILQVSRIVSEYHTINKTIGGKKIGRVDLILNLMPGYSVFEIMRLIKERITIRTGETVENLLTGMLNKRLGQAVLKAAGITPLSRRTDSLMQHEAEVLAHLINRWSFETSGIVGWVHSQATAGGVPFSEIEIDTMESKVSKGVYLAGEVLNVDGDCGGFNLQWAWSSGFVAGEAAAKSLFGG